MRLISMADFVLSENITDLCESDTQVIAKVINYANFLKKPLKLGMFVPCDENDVPLREPIKPWQDSIMDEGIHMMYNIDLEMYQKAKERVLFDEFIVIGHADSYTEIELKNADLWISFIDDSIKLTNQFSIEYNVYKIEDLIDEDLTLTESAKKQIGL